MARLIFGDFEATGVDPRKDRITELCAIFYDTDSREKVEKHHYLHDETYPPIPEEITKLTQITEELLRAHGRSPAQVLPRLATSMARVDAVVFHNGTRYDKVLFEAECARYGVEVPPIVWIDTMVDLPYPPYMKSRKLSHLAIDHGIPVNPTELHGARADANLLRQIFLSYQVDEVLSLVKSPLMVLLAQVSFQDKEKAKERGFRWQEAGEKVFPKTWVKLIRECHFEKEAANCPFPVRKLLY